MGVMIALQQTSFQLVEEKQRESKCTQRDTTRRKKEKKKLEEENKRN
jgi:hypothetical protein